MCEEEEDSLPNIVFVLFLSVLYIDCFSPGVIDHRPLVSGSGDIRGGSCVNARPRPHHWSMAKTIRLYIGHWPRGGGPEAPSAAGPVSYILHNKVFVPIRNWFWRCCIKLLMVDILTSGKHFLEQPGPALRTFIIQTWFSFMKGFGTFDVLRFYFVKSKVLQRGCFTSPGQQWALLML